MIGVDNKFISIVIKYCLILRYRRALDQVICIAWPFILIVQPISLVGLAT
jgi:hypothetical protein